MQEGIMTQPKAAEMPSLLLQAIERKVPAHMIDGICAYHDGADVCYQAMLSLGWSSPERVKILTDALESVEELINVNTAEGLMDCRSDEDCDHCHMICMIRGALSEFRRGE